MDIPDDQLIAAFDRVPRPIREFLSHSELGPVATSLAQKYKLHVDTAGVLTDIITKTLLGFISPDQLQALLVQQLFLEQNMAAALMADINSLVFVPLQQKVREFTEAEKKARELEAELNAADEEGSTVSLPTQPRQIEPVKPQPLPPPALQYEPKPQTLPGSPVPVPVSQPVAVPTPHELVVQQAVPLPTQPIHVVHTAPTQPAQPGWHPAAAVHIFVPTHGGLVTPQPHTPVQVPIAPQEPQYVAPVIPQPIYPQPAPQQVPVPTPPVTPAPSSRPIEKAYGNDPYREPI